MLGYKALKGDTSDHIPGVPGVGEKTAIQLLQQFGSLDAIYDHLDEVKGKLRDRLAEHRESAFLSREVGSIVIDLPVELDLESARTGRYDRRAIAQRFRELEFRTLIDPLPPSTVGAPLEPEASAGGLQLSLDLGGRGDAAPAPAATATNGQAAVSRERSAPDPLADPRGAIEGVDPRIVGGSSDREALDAWLEERSGDVALGWGIGQGRSLEPAIHAAGPGGSDGSARYLPWNRARGPHRLPGQFVP